MKEKKNVKIDFRTFASVKKEAQDYQYSYEEIFLLGLQCIRDEDTYRLMKIRKLEEEVRDLQCKLDDYDVLKFKLKNKVIELENKRRELCVSDKVDVVTYNRNKKLNIVIGGLLDKYYSSGVSVEDFIKKNNINIQEVAVNNNLDMNLIIEEFKKKIMEEK